MLDLLIKNLCITTKERNLSTHLGVKDGKIACYTTKEIPALQVNDAQGYLLLPGAVDGHCHLNDPGFTWREDLEHATRAAALGGITTIIDMPLQNDPPTISAEALKKKREGFLGRSSVDGYFLGGCVDGNEDELLSQLDAGALGLKIFLGPVSPDYSTLSYAQVERIMDKLSGRKEPLLFHAEDASMICEREKISVGRDMAAFLASRPLVAELFSVDALISLARETKARIHICHVSHPKVAERIEEAAGDGVAITAETCTHYLCFSREDALEKGNLFKCAPPLRETEDREKLWDYVRKGTLSIASDHSPCRAHEKEGDAFEAWGGISGLFSLLEVSWSEGKKRGLSDEELIYALSEKPARDFGIHPQKGSLAIGSDADLVLFAPDEPWTIKKEDLRVLNPISAFIGLKGKGKVKRVYLRGEKIVDKGKIVEGRGIWTLKEEKR